MSKNRESMRGVAVHLYSTTESPPDVIFHGDKAQEKAEEFARAHGGGWVRAVACIITQDTKGVSDKIDELQDALDDLERTGEEASHQHDRTLRIMQTELTGLQNCLDEANSHITGLFNAMGVRIMPDVSLYTVAQSLVNERFYHQSYVHQLEVALGLEGVPETTLRKLRRHDYVVDVANGTGAVAVVVTHGRGK